jgi:hypothetical protein
MPRIETHNLLDLAERPAGKTYLGELIRRLVFATVARQQPNLHFLAGESNGYAGWDGWVEVSYEENGVVRRHRSIWELSTDRGFEAKFKRDFEAAATKTLPSGWSKNEVVYVGLTLRSVTPNALTSIKSSFDASERAKWGGVVLLAADDLVQWIEKVPSVEDWATAEFQIGSGRFGRSLEHWFAAWAKQATPPVTEQLITAGRDLTRLATAFRAESRSVHTLLCDSTEEAIAAIYCAVRLLNEADSQLVMACSLVVEDDGQADRLATQALVPLGMPTVILVPPATRHRNRLLDAGYRVLQALGRADDSSDVIRLERASIREFAAALEQSMAIDPVKAEVMARSVGSSVSIWHIQSLFNNAQQPRLPEWINGERTDAVIAAVFAGAWREDSSRDLEVLRTLSGMDDAQLSMSLSRFAGCTTPLLELIGAHRFVIAPTAAFEFIRRDITRHHIARLSQAISDVFSGVSQAVKDRWEGSSNAMEVRNAREEISGGLRDGLAETLLRIAVLGAPLAESGALLGHATAQSYVDQLIRAIDGLSTDPRILASLDRQLPVLIEAAPTPFVDALDALVQGAPDGLTLMLADEPGIFGRSFHTGLLWGLEALAWSAELLPRVAHLLAALARIDRDGKIANRPFNSLCEIFLPWHPGTSSDPQTRTDILRSVVEREPEVGWRVLVALLPGQRRTSTPTHRPKWRNLGQLDRRSIKRRELSEAYELSIALTLEVAGTDPSRLADIVDQYPNLAPHHKVEFEEAIRGAVRTAPAAELLQRLWSRIEKLVRHHARFAEADWAMPKGELERLEALAGEFELKDPVLRHRWLFDEQFPNLGVREDDYDARSELLRERRHAALVDVLSSAGWEGINRLVGVARYPYIVGVEVGRLECEDVDVLNAMHAWQLQDEPGWLPFRSASHSRAITRGDAWTAKMLAYAGKREWPPVSVAMALVDYPDTLKTYKLVEDQGIEVSKAYWTRRFGYIHGANEVLGGFSLAVEAFLHHGRAADLIDQNGGDLIKLGSDRVLEVIDAFIRQPPDAETVRSYSSIPYQLQRLFDWLREQPSADIEALARREYAFLPLLTNHGIERSELALHKLLQRQPEFFVDVICDLYRAASGEPELPAAEVEAAKTRARLAFELLSSWKTPPGVDGKAVNADVLGSWVKSARELLTSRDRAEIGDQAIGKLVYYLPKDAEDKVYPPVALRALLESWKSEDIEVGIEIEAFNSRGVYSRSVEEGGKQERELASRWIETADTIGPAWPRARALCLRIADSWIRRAAAEDIAARRDRARQSR